MLIVFVPVYFNVLQLILFSVLDPRTNSWPLIGDPMPGLTIIGLYLYFVTNWGPNYMKHKKPYELKTLLVLYNFIQVCVSVYIFAEVSKNKTCNFMSNFFSSVDLKKVVI